MRHTVNDTRAVGDEPFTSQQADLVLQAMKAVATCQGRATPTPEEVLAMDEARLALHATLEPSSLANSMPTGMKAALETKARRETALDFMIAVVLSGHSLDSAKVGLVERAALDLGLWEAAEALAGLAPSPAVVTSASFGRAKQPAA